MTSILGLQDCSDQGSGFGFFNASTVTSGADEITDDDCGDIPPVPVPTAIKVVDGGVPVQQPDGSWTIVYAVTVTNADVWRRCTRSPTAAVRPRHRHQFRHGHQHHAGQPNLGRLTDIVVFVGPRIIAPHDQTPTR